MPASPDTSRAILTAWQIRNYRRLVNDAIVQWCLTAQARVDQEWEEWSQMAAEAQSTLEVPPPPLHDRQSIAGIAYRWLAHVDSQHYLRPRGVQPKLGQRSITALLNQFEVLGDTLSYRSYVRMQPRAFHELVRVLAPAPVFRDTLENGNRRRGRSQIAVEEQVALTLLRLGGSGNFAGYQRLSQITGLSQGTCHACFQRVLRAVLELEDRVVTWASPSEEREAKEWVKARVDPVHMPSWSKGWCVMDGCHFQLAVEPGLSTAFFNRKQDFSYNCLLISMPHNLRIISAVTGFRGNAHDSRLWSSSPVCQKPRLFLDEGDFIWVDGGFEHNEAIISPFRRNESEGNPDRRLFNNMLSHLQVRAEHCNRLLRGRFQCLGGLREQLAKAPANYRGLTVGEEKVNNVMRSAIVLHNFALPYEDPHDHEFYMNASGEGWVADALQAYRESPEVRAERRNITSARERAQERLEERRVNEVITQSFTRRLHDRREDFQHRRTTLFNELKAAMRAGFTVPNTAALPGPIRPPGAVVQGLQASQ